MNVLIAGTGILGRNLIDLYLKRGDHVRAAAYSTRGFAGLEHPNLQTLTCDITRPETLTGICDGIDLVISSIGITRMKGNLTHMSVDFQGNLNLLKEAEKSGVKTFGFISPAGVDEGWKSAPLLHAKYLFETELKKSSVEWLIFRAGGFFNDLKEMGQMAQKGPMFVIGSGENFFTPVDARDLAEVMVEDLDVHRNRIITVGGPEDMSWNAICHSCFAHYNRKPQIIKFPAWLCSSFIWMLKPFSRSGYAMGKLMVFMSTTNLPTDKRGKRSFSTCLNS